MKKRLSDIFFTRGFIALCALLLLVGGMAVGIRGHAVIGGLLAYLGVMSLFLICWHAFRWQSRAEEEIRDAENYGRSECSNCTSCKCREPDETIIRFPRKGS